ncbi:hypothetical protein IEQ34_007424 [Dendrobium chrysotoxum]|uniref:Ribulose bisphosphate carboxylase large chain n=1 Tax=Dendrobium chrysotoxum TaxID=161865 RepID=A0AAV7H9E7_DENCH|nr:hypothetical protein IEQ34_007424 [Dendrobium chrysotoxum]
MCGVQTRPEANLDASKYETKDTDILAAFRVTPQLGVSLEEAGAAVAVESSNGEDNDANLKLLMIL